MSPARKHRDRFAAMRGTANPATAIVNLEGGGRPAPVATSFSPAREHLLARALAIPASGEGDDAVSPALDRESAQVAMRLQHDLRRLKEIQSIERKIDAKREMLPEYAPWIDGLIAADNPNAGELSAEVLPTMMVWRIDTGDYAGALALAEFVLRHDVPLPHRYQRAAPALIAEEIANAALKAQLAEQPFDLDVLHRVEELTADADMHDEIRAKLFKAIGFEMAREIDAMGEQPAALMHAAALAALEPLKRAQALHERCGVKDRIKRLEKIVAATAAT